MRTIKDSLCWSLHPKCADVCALALWLMCYVTNALFITLLWWKHINRSDPSLLCSDLSDIGECPLCRFPSLTTCFDAGWTLYNPTTRGFSPFVMARMALWFRADHYRQSHCLGSELPEHFTHEQLHLVEFQPRKALKDHCHTSDTQVKSRQCFWWIDQAQVSLLCKGLLYQNRVSWKLYIKMCVDRIFMWQSPYQGKLPSNICFYCSLVST